MHCQQFQPLKSPDRRKSRNRSLVSMAETEDYLCSHARTTHSVSRLLILLLLHSFYHDLNQLWASILLELLARRRRSDTLTFWVKNILNQDCCQTKFVSFGACKKSFICCPCNIEMTTFLFFSLQRNQKDIFLLLLIGLTRSPQLPPGMRLLPGSVQKSSGKGAQTLALPPDHLGAHVVA